MADEGTSVRPGGHIEDVGMLDLRWAKSAEDLSEIISIEDVGVILVPEQLIAALGKVDIQDVSLIVPIPPGDNVHVMSGEVRLTGEMLAGGNPEAILILVGQVNIASVVQSIGYRELRVYGQLFAPRGSEGAIAGKLTQFSGKVFYLPANARTLTGQTAIGQAYLELLPEPSPLVVMGDLEMEADVTVETLRANVPEIALIGGNITAPKALLPILQVLTREKTGEIREREA